MLAFGDKKPWLDSLHLGKSFLPLIVFNFPDPGPGDLAEGELTQLLHCARRAR